MASMKYANCGEYLFNSPWRSPCGDRLCKECFESLIFGSSRRLPSSTLLRKYSVTISTYHRVNIKYNHHASPEWSACLHFMMDSQSTISCIESHVKKCTVTVDEEITANSTNDSCVQEHEAENASRESLFRGFGNGCKNPQPDTNSRPPEAKIDEEQEEDEVPVRSKTCTQDRSYSLLASKELLEKATEETTKYNLKDSELVNIKKNTVVVAESRRQTWSVLGSHSLCPPYIKRLTQKAASELTHSVPISLFFNEDKEPEPPKPFTFDDGVSTSSSEETYKVPIEEESLCSNVTQELVLCNDSIQNQGECYSMFAVNEYDSACEVPCLQPCYKPFLNQFGSLT